MVTVLIPAWHRNFTIPAALTEAFGSLSHREFAQTALIEYYQRLEAH